MRLPPPFTHAVIGRVEAARVSSGGSATPTAATALTPRVPHIFGHTTSQRATVVMCTSGALSGAAATFAGA